MAKAGRARVVAIGPREEMFGLRSVGVEVVAVEAPSDVEQSLRAQAARPEVRLILVSESVADGAQKLVEDLREATGTMIMAVPSHLGSRGMTLTWMKHAMEQLLGVDVISNK